ncbi:hypothetical protein [Streptomyces sp. DT195]|uniref:hypothetical protein n=1 Tax=Streptomyces sp. DT195 TaxID=3393419 RepID=UPI003CF06869
MLEQVATALSAAATRSEGASRVAVQAAIGWDQVTEDVLRHQPPIATIIMRFAVRDVVDEPTGLHFAAGDALVINYAAANRDPDVHGPDADRFDPSRTTARGHWPSAMASTSASAPNSPASKSTALRALFAGFPDLQLAVPAADLAPLAQLHLQRPHGRPRPPRPPGCLTHSQDPR